MDEFKFGSICASVILATFILSITGYWMHHNSVVARLIEAGVDPIAVKCALEDDFGIHPVCIVLAVKTK